jgi:uncharacterized protein YjiS (DUF1127 family)
MGSGLTETAATMARRMVRAISRLVAAGRAWTGAIHVRYRLRELDDRMLRDIGVERSDLGPTLPEPHFGDIRDLSRRRPF